MFGRKKINSFILSLLYGLFCGYTVVYAQNNMVIQHQLGAYSSYMEVNGNQMQKVHEYRQTVYVIKGETVTLALPATGEVAPNYYRRWYDYQTDGLMNNLSCQNATRYRNGYVQSGSNAMEASYQFDGTPVVVACDVSAYKNQVSDKKILLEPTLSYRAIYEIRDASEQADALRQCTEKNQYLENYTIYVPKTDKLAGAADVQRICLKYASYYGHAVDTYNNFWGGFDRQENKLKSGELFENESYAVCQNNNRFIQIYPSRVLADRAVLDVSLNCYNSTYSYWGSEVSKKLVRYNLARFTLIFTDELPMKYDELPDYRKLEKMDAEYLLLSKETFERQGVKEDTAKVTQDNNLRRNPMEYDVCSYGYVHKTLRNNTNSQFENQVSQWNEYGLYKTANVLKAENYEWYNNGYQVYDRLYYESKKTKNGYFMYIDAAEVPGTVAKLPIGRLCSGTKLFVTAAVASLTKDKYDPNLNLVFVGIDAAGVETELSRYTTGDIPKPEKTPQGDTPWWQVFFSFTYHSEIDYERFYVRIENNCLGTNGGDYAVDDIRIYRVKPTVQANQVMLPCGAEQAQVEVWVDFDKLLEVKGLNENEGENELRILDYKYLTDQDGNGLTESDVLKDYNYNTEEDPDYEYGRIRFYTRFDKMRQIAVDDIDNSPIAYSKSDNIVVCTKITEDPIDHTRRRYVVFKTPNNKVLNYRQDYYTSVSDRDGNFGVGQCAIISEPFRITPPYEMTVGGDSWIESEGVCYGNEQTLTAFLRDRITNEPIDCEFDWFVNMDFSLVEADPIKQALLHYRNAYPLPLANEADNTLSPVWVEKGFSESDYALLQKYIDEGRMFLSRTNITRIIRYGESLVAVPVEATAKFQNPDIPTDTRLTFCSSFIPVEAKGPNKNPTVDFGSVTLGKPIALRMGYPDYLTLNNDTYRQLVIPVNDYSDTDKTKTRKLELSDDRNVYLIATNDHEITINSENQESLKGIATVENISVSGANTDNSISFSFEHRDVVKLREGYTYKIEFKFNQEYLPSDEEVPCDGTGVLYIKIVPEYLTWTGEDGDNWNNDANWKRTVKSEIYKQSGYTDDLLAHGFVPISSSKVVVPKNTSGPWLYPGKPDPENNRIESMVNTNYKDTSVNKATADIQHDLIVYRDNSDFYCRHFCSNACSQIYFAAGAEMRNTHLLNYQRAHVELELDKNRWLMPASPLQGVVAGDMYLPTAGARQETEAFTDIQFDTRWHNRFSPAVYQRSWDKASAQIIPNPGSSPTPDPNVWLKSDWSLAYNRVDESYQPGSGFSIRVEYEGEGEKALFRLPKADASYLYYDQEGTVTGNNTVIDRSVNGKLVDTPDGVVKVPLVNSTDSNPVYLVGNPYMATLDMSAFFDGNPGLERSYQILTPQGMMAASIDADGQITSTLGSDALASAEAGLLAPMQGFFVSAQKSVSDVVFTPAMTVEKPKAAADARSVGSGASGLRITAHRATQTNSMLLVRREDADDSFVPGEDVAALMDSNLSDMPLLYSISGNQAAVINCFSGRKLIPFGIYSEREEEVALSFEGVGSMQEAVFLYDAVSDTSTPVTDGDTIRVAGNTHGRYFLRLGDEQEYTEPEISVYSPAAETLVVASSAADPLRSVRVYTIGGMLIREASGMDDMRVVFNLAAATYVVTVQTDKIQQTQKVICKK